MRLLVDHFPLIVSIPGATWDKAEVQSIIDGFEPYLRGKERYAAITVSRPGAKTPGPAERKMLAEWMDHPRVRDSIRRLCVASATVVPGVLERTALTVIQALAKPACPSDAAATIERALDFCLPRLREEGLKLPKPPEALRFDVIRAVEVAIKA
jgi:hypothetical protein